MSFKVVADVELVIHHIDQENGIPLIFTHTSSGDTEFPFGEERHYVVNVVGVHVVKVHHCDTFGATEPNYSVVFPHEVGVSKIGCSEGASVFSLEHLDRLEGFTVQYNHVVSDWFLDDNVARIGRPQSKEFGLLILI